MQQVKPSRAVSPFWAIVSNAKEFSPVSAPSILAGSWNSSASASGPGPVEPTDDTPNHTSAPSSHSDVDKRRTGRRSPRRGSYSDATIASSHTTALATLSAKAIYSRRYNHDAKAGSDLTRMPKTVGNPRTDPFEAYPVPAQPAIHKWVDICMCQRVFLCESTFKLEN